MEAKKARERLRQSIRYYQESIYFFGVGKYKGFYQGNVRSWQFSQYLKLCKERVVRDLEKWLKLYRKK